MWYDTIQHTCIIHTIFHAAVKLGVVQCSEVNQRCSLVQWGMDVTWRRLILCFDMSKLREPVVVDDNPDPSCPVQEDPCQGPAPCSEWKDPQHACGEA